MYWWENSAKLLREGNLKRFGLIATNSLRQTYNRKILENHFTAKTPISLIYAVPDHPWVDERDGAAVRISMTVATTGELEGVLAKVSEDSANDDDGVILELTEQKGRILADVSIGPDVAVVGALKANEAISYRGVILGGAGFIVTPDQALDLGLGRVAGLEKHIRSLITGRDLAQRARNIKVIELSNLSIEDVQNTFPEVYQWILDRVKPERDQNRDKLFRARWWVFGRPRHELRQALVGLDRYIATARTAKHRVFQFLPTEVLPESEVVAIALSEAGYLGILSSRIHVTWALAAGGRLGVGNDPRYNNSRCFEPFPFPLCTNEQITRIGEIAEFLEPHRKRQQSLHPKLTMTDMYNVLEKLRAEQPLTEKEKGARHKRRRHHTRPTRKTVHPRQRHPHRRTARNPRLPRPGARGREWEVRGVSRVGRC